MQIYKKIQVRFESNTLQRTNTNTLSLVSRITTQIYTLFMDKKQKI